MRQEWNHVLFLNWKVDPDLLRGQVPFELDLYDGMAVVSVVPFQMSGIQFSFAPKVPFLNSLWELNLRTYVKHEGRVGVYFFTLDTDIGLAKWIARSFFDLPYEIAEMKPRLSRDLYSFTSSRKEYFLHLQVRIENHEVVNSAFDRWVMERYFLFSMKDKQVISGEVLHPPWKPFQARLIEYIGDFESLVGLKFSKNPDSIAYVPQLKVRFLPFSKVQRKQIG